MEELSACLQLQRPTASSPLQKAPSAPSKESLVVSHEQLTAPSKRPLQRIYVLHRGQSRTRSAKVS